MQRLGYVALALGLLGLDQVSKIWAAGRLEDAAPIDVVPGLFRLVLVRNRGALFGMFQELQAPLRVLVFLALPCAVIAILAWLASRTPPGEKGSQGAFALLLGGALGNLVDRVRLGHVIDFLDFYIQTPGGGSHHWPAFNLADACICAGIALLALDSWRGRHDTHKERDHAPDSV
jgi:signal peptidase II